MLTVTFLFDRDLGLRHPVCLPGADVSSRSGSHGPRDIRLCIIPRAAVVLTEAVLMDRYVAPWFDRERSLSGLRGVGLTCTSG